MGVKVDSVEAEGIQYTRKDSVVEDLVVEDLVAAVAASGGLVYLH